MAEPVELWMVLTILFAMSVVYNEMIAKVNKESEGNHPLAAAAVAVGVLFTVFGAYLLGAPWECIWLIMICFVASGTWMIVGDVGRWLARRKRKI